MINALRAETRRLFARRITLVALLTLLGLIALFQLEVNSQVSPPSAAEVAEMRQDYDEYVQDWEAHHEEWEAECTDSGGTPEECAQPRPTLAEWGLEPVGFAEAAQPAISFAVYLGGMALFVAMASFIGAEATTGSLANWLTFVPNRTRVLVSKLVVVAAFSLLVGAAVGLLTVGLSSLVTSLHGQPLTGLGDLVAMATRGALIVGIFGVAGFAVGTLTASTGASIGVLLGAFLVTYTQTVLALISRWAQHLTPWSPGPNLQAILEGKTTYTLSTGPVSPMDQDPTSGSVEKTISLAHGLGYWAVVLAALLALTWLLFRRRDIT